MPFTQTFLRTWLRISSEEANHILDRDHPGSMDNFRIAGDRC
jgi:hypothetical protein